MVRCYYRRGEFAVLDAEYELEVSLSFSLEKNKYVHCVVLIALVGYLTTMRCLDRECILLGS